MSFSLFDFDGDSFHAPWINDSRMRLLQLTSFRLLLLLSKERVIYTAGDVVFKQCSIVLPLIPQFVKNRSFSSEVDWVYALDAAEHASYFEFTRRQYRCTALLALDLLSWVFLDLEPRQLNRRWCPSSASGADT